MMAGSLCTGIGGLDIAVEAHFGAHLAWYAEVEAAPCVVLEREWPGVPNLRDLTALDWSSVEPVDVLTAGYPCQPFSHAGKRQGADDERHLWPYIADAVRVLRPRWVVLENVAGHLSLGFDTVLADLAEAGFDAEWCVLRASDVGAPHQRARIFIVATDARRAERRAGATAADTRRHAWAQDHTDIAPAAWSGGSTADSDQLAARRYRGTAPRAQGTNTGRGEPDFGHGPADGDLASADSDIIGPQGRREPGSMPGLEAPGREPAGAHPAVPWGDYESAVRRWEHTIGRPAPAPMDDRGRLSSAFVEWMMGYPAGWVDGLTRTQALKALGNAVVPQQALAALQELAPARPQEPAA